MIKKYIYLNLEYKISMNDIEKDDLSQLKSFGTYKPIMALNKDSFKEMQQFFVLKIITDNPEGITAYQLANNYQINRSTVKLMLSYFEEKAYITSNTEVIDGRANKLYFLTDSGFDYLLQLKYIWFERFRMMEELTLRNLTSNEKKHYIKKIENYKTKEERLEYLKAMHSRHKNNMRIYEIQYRTFVKMDEEISYIINKIEKEDYLDKKELERFFDLAIDIDLEIKEKNTD